MLARRSFSLKILCLEFTRQTFWTKGSLTESWDFQFVPERFLPLVLSILAVIAFWKLEKLILQSLAARGPWPISNGIIMLLQLIILTEIFSHVF